MGTSDTEIQKYDANCLTLSRLEQLQNETIDFMHSNFPPIYNAS